MNNERYQEIIDDAYEHYSEAYKKDKSVGLTFLIQTIDGKAVYRKPDRQMFIAMCTYDKSFSERWGLKIEERELSFNKRYRLGGYRPYNIEGKVVYLEGLNYITQDQFERFHNLEMNKLNIPTRLITLTYKDEKIKVYE